MKNRLPKKRDKSFWDKEYRQNAHFVLSENPSEDLVKFTRWLVRRDGRKFLNSTAWALDLGSGNGRNLIYLAREFGMRGAGLDISAEANKIAERESQGLPLKYETRSIAEPLPFANGSQTLVLDMMTAHFLNQTERKNLFAEIARVLKPNGWFFWKTFLLDEDLHAKRLIRESPAEEKGSYIHPKIGVLEHVFTEEEITDVLSVNFTIHKIIKSHRHRDSRGGPLKRRSVSVYAQKN